MAKIGKERTRTCRAYTSYGKACIIEHGRNGSHRCERVVVIEPKEISSQNGETDHDTKKD